MGRILGIRHRRKKTVEGEPRPTQVVIVDGVKDAIYNLPDDQAELDFVFGLFPIRYRATTPDDEAGDFHSHQLKWRKLDPATEDPEKIKVDHVKKSGKKYLVLDKVPCDFAGPRRGDVVALPLGGSGDMLSYALVRRAEEIGAAVVRLPPFRLKVERGDEDKDEDVRLIARLVAEKPELFYPIQSRDKQVILMRELFRERINAMKARIAGEQQLYQVFVGKIFTNVSPEAEIEKRFEEEKANSQILQNLLTLEKEANGRLFSAIEDLDIYQHVFAPIEGVGPQTAARVLAGVVDIRRFPDREKFVAFCGVSPGQPDGRFRRRRRGEIGNWSPAVRQGLWLIVADQANKRPDSIWGQRLRQIKAELRAKHPEVVIDNGKRRYTDGHIHKMAIWKTAVKLARYIYREWSALENQAGGESQVAVA
ncbi:MAG: transposase [Patescibacteria group bacterium]